MASITEELDTAKTYMQLGIGMGADLALDSILIEIMEGRVQCLADVVRWVRDSRARLEEHHVCD